MPMTALPSANGLLEQCCDNPDDAVTPLIYADYLEIECGDAARAEFIRVQVELARLHCAECGGCGEVGPCGLTDYYRRCYSCNGENSYRWKELRRRESQLVFDNPQWRPVCLECNGSGKKDDLYVCKLCQVPDAKWHGSGRVGEFRHGILRRVPVPSLASVMTITENTRMVGERYWVDKTPYATALLAESPSVREVVPVDMRPWELDTVNRAWWAEGGAQVYNHATLPRIIFNHLAGHTLAFGGATYTSDELAVSALARAVHLTLKELP